MARKRAGSGPAAGSLDPGRLKLVPQGDQTWEADFRALPKPATQSRTRYLGVAVARDGGLILARTQVEGRPEARDLAALLDQAISGTACRPRRLHLRGHPQWRELFPALEALGIAVSVERELPAIEDAYAAHLRELREACRAGMVGPTPQQAAIEALFPAVARWVQGHGHIEIGDQESFGFAARALGHGGELFESDKPDTLAEALAALDRELARHFESEEAG